MDMAASTEKQIIKLREIIHSAKNAVFFGGAGVSTESGIPDFRSESGLYYARQVYGKKPEYLLSHSCFAREPELFFRYYKENLVAREAKPNAAHFALAKFEEQGRLSAIVTQNVDGLHQAAGSKAVCELHGSNWRQFCVKCQKKYSLDYIMEQEGIPKCEKCGGTVRPEVVLYEESLPQKEWNDALRAIEGADLLIVGGTSLAVYPAAGLLEHFCGANLVLINKSETPADGRAQLVIRDAIGKTLGAV
jgi:NAD-dependent deacetylase